VIRISLHGLSKKHVSSFAIAAGVVESLCELAGYVVCRALQKSLIEHTHRFDYL
jgi:hypothetical protein